MTRQLGSVNVIIIIVIGLVLAFGVYWLRPTPDLRPLIQPQPPIVSVVAITSQRQQMQVKTQGTIVPSREINLVAEVSGRVVSVSDVFVNGGFFSRGDVLVTLDKRDYQYRLAEAVAQVAAAERELALEKGQARQAQREWRDLGSDEANALSLRAPQVKAAEAQLSSAIAQRRQAEVNMERATIRAPFTGRIQAIQVNAGQYVTAGTVVAAIYDSALAEVRLPLTDKQLALVGIPLGITLTREQQNTVMLSAMIAGVTHYWPATLTRTEASIDDATRLYFAIAEIPDPFNLERYPSPLISGLFVEANIMGVELENVVQVPEKAMYQNRFVYLVDENNLTHQREVTVLAKEGSVVWVQGEFTDNEKLIVSDPKVLQPNIVVTQKVTNPS
jgi:RND family efflux transporter MFP subunit